MTKFKEAKVKFDKYPLRICKTLHTCQLCNDCIKSGETYYDGGSYNKRAHEKCILTEQLKKYADVCLKAKLNEQP